MKETHEAEMTMSVTEQARKRFMQVVLAVASVQAAFFLAMDLLWPPSRTEDLALNGGTLLVSAGLYWWLRKSERTEGLTRIVTGVTMIALFVLIHVAENPLVAGMFLPIFPLIAFFLRGRREGAVWLGIYGLGVMAYFAAVVMGVWDRPYLFASGTMTQVINMVIYLVVIYFYVEVEDKSRKLLMDQAEEERRINGQLSVEIETRKRVEAELGVQTSKLKEMNEALVGRELAMIELKKENARLKTQA